MQSPKGHITCIPIARAPISPASELDWFTRRDLAWPGSSRRPVPPTSATVAAAWWEGGHPLAQFLAGAPVREGPLSVMGASGKDCSSCPQENREREARG